MKIDKTNREFQVIDFKDRNYVECSLQKSSLATEEAIWLGVNDSDPKQCIGGQWTPIEMPEGYHSNTRMHLTQDQVRELLPYLLSFAELGELGSWPAGQVFDVEGLVKDV